MGGDKINCSVARRSSGQQVDQKKSSCLDREEIVVMGQARLLLLTLSLAYVQGCTLKDNAKELISVGYFTDEQGTAVDRIEVKMRDGCRTTAKEKGTRKSTYCTGPKERLRHGKKEAKRHFPRSIPPSPWVTSTPVNPMKCR